MGDHLSEGDSRLIEPVGQRLVLPESGLIDLLLSLGVGGQEHDLVCVLFHLDHLSRIHHGQEFIIVDLHHLFIHHIGEDQGI